MKANELRIGNYYIENNQVCRVEHYDISSAYFNPDMYKPIPLTEGWLLKFGFEKKIGWDDLIYHVKNNVDLYEFLSGYEYYDFHIKHVHQLQNLYFALTGEELKTIKR